MLQYNVTLVIFFIETFHPLLLKGKRTPESCTTHYALTLSLIVAGILAVEQDVLEPLTVLSLFLFLFYEVTFRVSYEVENTDIITYHTSHKK